MPAEGIFGRRGGPALVAPPALRPVAAVAQPENISRQPTVRSFAASDPILTGILLLAMVAVFLAEQRFAIGPGHAGVPSLRTIVALGGLSRALAIGKGEWWRLFTAPFLHGGLSHIAGNAIAFFFAGMNLERIAGRRWLAALFFLGALGGVSGSLLMNAPETVTVGASGAIMCLLAALLVLSFDSHAVKNPARVQRRALFLLIPALAPAAGGAHIDISAHIGGTMVGTMLGFLLQITWREDEEAHAFKRAAAWVGAVGALVTLLSFGLVAAHYRNAGSATSAIPDLQLMSEDDLPADAAQADRKSSDYVRKFPDDPRAHFFRAVFFIRGHDMTSAQEQLRTALDERQVLSQLPQSFTATLQVLLAATLAEQGRLDDARSTAAPACTAAADDDRLYTIMNRLKEEEICP
ncbi:MAG TPA: rhomboid family intramembrane serine protease [Rhizomicrobium sp.]|jgi:rhomboid protease GluP